MKETIIHTALSCMLLLGICGCSKDCTECQDAPQPPVPALLDLNITLPTQADESDIPERERVKELRLILIDKSSGKVEYNNTLDLQSLSPSVDDDPRFRYSYHIRLESTVGAKCIYALANAEHLIGDIATEEEGARLMENLDKIELSEDIYALNNGSNIPIVSRRYEVELGGQSSTGEAITEQKAEIVMAYAATKWEFTFENKFGDPKDSGDSGNGVADGTESTDKNIDIIGWQITSVAKKSYLVPHMKDDAWEKLIELGGTTNSDVWVIDYDLPANTTHEVYDLDYQEKEPLDYHESFPDPTTYYIHESKNIGTSTEQEYLLSLKIKPRGSENNPPMILTGKLPNLKSLVRGTHVQVHVTLRNMPDPGDNTLEVRVKTWINDEPVNGTWEEVTQ